MPLSVIFSVYSPLLPIIVATFLLKKIKDWRLWVIFFYCILSLLNDSILIYRDSRGLSIREFYHVFTIIEHLIFATYLFSIIINRTIRNILATLSAVLTAFCLYILLQGTLDVFDSVQASMSAIILIAFCIIYLFEQINKPELTFIYSSHNFWIVSAILISVAATLFLYGFAATLPTEIAQQYWVINHISNLLKNILFSIAIIIHVKTPKKPTSPTFMEPDYQPYLN